MYPEIILNLPIFNVNGDRLRHFSFYKEIDKGLHNDVLLRKDVIQEKDIDRLY